MIKFIFLLPFKIIGVVFLAIGAAIDNSNRRKLEREKQAARAAMEQQKAMKAAAARIEKEKRERARGDRQAQSERRRIEKEKAAQAVKAQKATERRKAEKFKADQARTDIVHYEQQRRELLKLYDELKKQFDAAATDKQKEIVFRKQIALNNQIRGVDRQIEKAQYTINKSGPA